MVMVKSKDSSTGKTSPRPSKRSKNPKKPAVPEGGPECRCTGEESQTKGRKVKSSKSPLLMFIFASLFALLFLSSGARAVSTQDYSKIYLSPFYRDSLTSNTNYTYSIDVTPPIRTVVASAIIGFDVYMNPAVTFSIYVNGQPCSTPNFVISTTYSGASQARLTFDCSNVITKQGTYIVTLRSSKNTGSITGWLDVAYSQNQASIETFGTEYSPNEPARVFVRLLDTASQPISIGSCNTTIYFPNNTKFINNQAMTLLEKGYYYYDLTTPAVTGNYIVGFDCVVPTTRFIQNYSLSGATLTSGNTMFDFYFGFDNSNNNTINNAYVEVSETASLAGSSMGVNFNGRRVGTMSGISPALGNYSLTQADFGIFSEQHISFTYEGTGTISLIYTRLVVNFTSQNPSQIVRGQNEIHIGSLYNSLASTFTKPYVATSFCGAKYASTYKEGTSDCAKFVNDTDYGLPEGATEDNVTIVGTQTFPNTYWRYILPMGTDCNALYWVKTNVTGSWQTMNTSNFIFGWMAESRGCMIDIPINLTTTSTQSYTLRYDNYQKYKVLQDYALIQQVNKTTSDYCQSIATDNNYTYEIPIQNNTKVQETFNTNVNLFRCAMLSDVVFWAQRFWLQSLNATTSGDFGGYYNEFESFFAPHIMHNWDFYQSFLQELNTAPYEVQTLCSQQGALVEILTPTLGTQKQLHITADCAKIIPDLDFNFPEGELDDNFTVIPTRNELGDEMVRVHYQTPTGISCGAVYFVKSNVTGSMQTYPNVTFEQSASDNCEVDMLLYNLRIGTDIKFNIRMDNYMAYKVMQAKGIVDSVNSQTMNYICNPLAVQNGYTFATPILNSTVLTTNPVLLTCHYMADLIWWNSYFYNQSINRTLTPTAGLYQTYYLEISGTNAPTLARYVSILNGFLLNKTETANVNYTYFDSQFNQSQLNQQTIYNQLQANNQSTYGWFQTTWSNIQTSFNFNQNMNSSLTTLITNFETNVNNSFVSLNSTMTGYYNSLSAMQTTIYNKIVDTYNELVTYIGDYVLHIPS